MAALQPDVLVKGADYAEDEIVGADLVRSWGGRLVRARLVPRQSTTRLVQRSHEGALTAEAVWSAIFLSVELLRPAVGLYGAFGLFAIGVPVIARRLHRSLEPAWGLTPLGAADEVGYPHRFHRYERPPAD